MTDSANAANGAEYRELARVDSVSIKPTVGACTLALWLLTAHLCPHLARGTENTSSRDLLPIILISIDTLRSDHLPAYGYSQIRTPAIDALRRDGILFEYAYSPVPLTLPAHVSLLSGQLPSTHGVRDNLGFHVGEELQPMLPQRLRDLGYRTGAAVSAFVLRSETGLAEGFEFYDDQLAAAENVSAANVQRSGTDTLAAALPWLRSVANEPFLLLIHFYEPHSPYEPPETFAALYPSAYDGEVAAADHAVGELLTEVKRLGAYDRALIVLFSDHGEGLGEHGEQEHGILLYREVLQVPLIVKLPEGQRAGEIVSQPVQLTDIAPTILSMVGIKPEENSAERLLHRPLPADGPIYAETFYPWFRFGWSYLLSLISDRFHYIQGPDPELYDLLQDPDETHNLLPERIDTARPMRLKLRKLHVMPGEPSNVDKQTKKALRSLGYVGSSASRRAGRLPDPKTRVHVIADVDHAIALLSAGKAETAVEVFRSALETDPGLVDAWQFLGLALRQLGRNQEALAALRQAYSLSGAPPELASTISQILFELGDRKAALRVLAVAIEKSPRDPELRLSRARVLMEEARLEEALRDVQTAVRLDPEDPDALQIRGSIRLQRNELRAAEADLRRALELMPGLRDAARDLAVLLMETGRTEEAVKILESHSGGPT